MSESLKNIMELLKQDGVITKELSEKVIISKNIDSKDKYGFTPLVYAVCGANLEGVKKLVALGADINTETRSSNTLLHLAVKYEQTDILQYLLEGISPPLSDAFCARSNNDGHTALHLAASIKNLDFLKILLRHKYFKNKSTDEDYYGWSAIDIASSVKNHDAVKILLGNEDLNSSELEMLPHYGKPLRDISQNNLNDKLKKFLTMTGRNGDDVLDSIGYCKGWEFLYQLSKNKEEFFEILHLLEQWDGEKDSLNNTQLSPDLAEKYKKIFPGGKEQAGCLIDVFEQLTNDLIYFQRQGNKTLIEKFEYLKNKSDEREIRSLGYFRLNINRAQLIEILAIYCRYPGARIDIGGAGHAVALHVSGEGDFIIHYYDSNARNKLKPFITLDSLADYIIKTKYKMLNKLSNASKLMNVQLRIFKIYDNRGQIPDVEKAIASSRNKFESPNNFTPLHYAVMENNLESIRQHLHHKNNSIYETDVHEISVLEHALIVSNHKIIQCLNEFIDANILIEGFNAYIKHVRIFPSNYSDPLFLVRRDYSGQSMIKILDSLDKLERANIVIFLLVMKTNLAYASYLTLVETLALNKKNASNAEIEKYLATKIRLELESSPLNLSKLNQFLTTNPELGKTIVMPLIEKYLRGINSVKKNIILDSLKNLDNDVVNNYSVKFFSDKKQEIGSEQAVATSEDSSYKDNDHGTLYFEG